MSALAARRAAAAAKAAAIPAPVIDPTPSTSSQRAIQRARKSPTPPSLSAESDGEIEPSFSDGNDEPGPSDYHRERNHHRKRPAPAPVDAAPSSPKLRYFAAVTETDARAQRKRRRKAFSPSAPAEAYDDDGEEDGEDSSAEEDGQGDDDDDRRRAREEVEEGRARWSAVSTPLVRTPGPSSARPTEVLGDGTVGSTFVPRRGVNMHTFTEDELSAAGIDEGSGAGVILSLSSGETLSIAGVFALVPLQGSISLLSSIIRPSSNGTHYPVFAPSSHPVPMIRPVSTHTALRGSTTSLSDLHLPRSFVLRDEETPRTIFLIREHRTGIEGMRGGAVPGFNNAWLEEKGAWGLKGVHPVIGSFPVPVYPHITPDSWTVALDSLNRLASPTANDGEEDVADILDEGVPTIALIKGPKRSGKSTIARAALNRLLDTYERVAWLECDLGQGEFGCGGVVGLWVIDRPILGPPFTHPRLPERAHYLGTYTPLTCPGEYLAAISHLFDHFRFEVQYPLSPATATPGRDGAKRSDVVPLVINTQGWVKGLGEELLRSIESMACPTHVLDFEPEPSPTADQGFHTPGWTRSPVQHFTPLPLSTVEDGGNGNGAGAVSYHLLEPAPISPLHTRYTPADMRVLSTLSYFYSRISPGVVSSSWDYSSPLTEQSPWEVILGEAIREVYVIGEGSDGVVPSDLPLALNGSVVALLERLTPSTLPQNSMQQEHGHGHDPSYVQARPPPPLDETTFLGLALIRAVSPNSPIKLHLLTPLPGDVLHRATIMVKNGAIELPAPGMMDFRDTRAQGAGRGGWEVPEEMPFFETGEAGVGGERRRFRRNIMRKGM